MVKIQCVEGVYEIKSNPFPSSVITSHSPQRSTIVSHALKKKLTTIFYIVFKNFNTTLDVYLWPKSV